MTWRLSVVHGPEIGKSYSLDVQTRIGRAPENEIYVSDTQISRHHAVIKRQGDSYIVSDLDSTNGTFVNGKRITEPVPLRVGDSITVGPARFVVLADKL
ncbi:MAG: FHA domain-containing protein [Anaerolineales bacterium]